MRDHIERYWQEIGDVTQMMPFSKLAAAADLLLECHRRGSTIFIIGNGGSAATASHFACDLAKGTRVKDQGAFRVMPLTDNVPLITAWANDTDYERIFAEQLESLVRPRDVVVVISASGNSRNVLAALEMARREGATTLALTGRTGGKVGNLADITIRVPSDSIEQVEDAHVVVAHSLCVALRHRLQADSLTTQTPAWNGHVDTVIDSATIPVGL